jgi:hypothetical protein
MVGSYGGVGHPGLHWGPHPHAGPLLALRRLLRGRRVSHLRLLPGSCLRLLRKGAGCFPLLLDRQVSASSLNFLPFSSGFHLLFYCNEGFALSGRFALLTTLFQRIKIKPSSLGFMLNAKQPSSIYMLLSLTFSYLTGWEPLRLMNATFSCIRLGNHVVRLLFPNTNSS